MKKSKYIVIIFTILLITTFIVFSCNLESAFKQSIEEDANVSLILVLEKPIQSRATDGTEISIINTEAEIISSRISFLDASSNVIVNTDVDVAQFGTEIEVIMTYTQMQEIRFIEVRNFWQVETEVMEAVTNSPITVSPGLNTIQITINDFYAVDVIVNYPSYGGRLNQSSGNVTTLSRNSFVIGEF